MNAEEFRALVAPYAGRIHIDIGAGDGLFVYHSARQNPDCFFIGVDPNIRPLAKISERIYRSTTRGGASNALYVQSAVESLPAEFSQIAERITVLFPWGSLLAAVAVPRTEPLSVLRRICRPGATMQIVIGVDPERDRTEFQRLQIPDLLSPAYKHRFIAHYKAAGFEVTRFHHEPEHAAYPQTTWSKKLKGDKRRSVLCITASAI